MTALQRLRAMYAALRGQVPEPRVITVPAPAADATLPDAAALREQAAAALEAGQKAVAAAQAVLAGLRGR